MCYSSLVVFCETLGIHHSMIILDSLISEVFTASDIDIRTLALNHFWRMEEIMVIL